MGIWSDLKKEFNRQPSVSLSVRNSTKSVNTSTRPKRYKLLGDMAIRRKNTVQQSYSKALVDFEIFIDNTISSHNIPVGIAREEDVLHRLFPNNNPQFCPVCHYDFEKPLSRGKVCPKCKNKLHVKHGYLLSDSDEQEYNRMYHMFWATGKGKILLESHGASSGFRIWSYYDVVERMAEVYEELEEYNKAWDCFSNKVIPASDGAIIDAYSDESHEPDAFLKVHSWRAGFAERRLRDKTWNVTPEWVADIYIDLIAYGHNLEIPKTSIEMNRAVQKLKNLYQTGSVGGEKLKELIYKQDISDFDEKAKNSLMKQITTR